MPYNINVTSEVYFVTHRKMMLHEYVTPETFQTDVSWITLQICIRQKNNV